MENTVNTINTEELHFSSKKRFDQKFIDAIYDETLDSIEIKALIQELKAQYKELLLETKEEIANAILEAKDNHLANLDKIYEELAVSLEDIEVKFESVDLSIKANRVDYENSKKGAMIVAKRAKIKENNDFDQRIKNIRLEKFFLFSDYSLIKSNITRKNSILDNLTASFYEWQAGFNFKAKLKDKAMWNNLIPIFMLTILICVYLTLAYTVNGVGYGGDTLWDKLDDIINNGVFVAVVATGAVFIYSSGSFDMSLGPASLMCATIAAIVWNTTHNIFLACIVAILIGMLLGIINAILANVLNLPVMVMTLTMMNILNSIHAVILKTQGNELKVELGLPNYTIIYATFLVCFFLLCWSIFNYTKLGRRNKLIGSNGTAAKFSGVSLMKAGIISFAISGIGLGICGFLFATDKTGSSFSTGTLLDTIGLNVVIAIVFGGMTTSGGPRSRVSCAVVGAFFCMFLDEIFKAASIADYRFLAKGIVFLGVSFFNMYSSRPKMLAR